MSLFSRVSPENKVADVLVSVTAEVLKDISDETLRELLYNQGAFVVKKIAPGFFSAMIPKRQIEVLNRENRLYVAIKPVSQTRE